jgi:hypothetical protein
MIRPSRTLRRACALSVATLALVTSVASVRAAVTNRSPLVAAKYNPLPLGSVRADGWLLTQLQLQRDGATGNAEALYTELGSNSAYLGGTAADSNWERPPYYVKGLVALAYALNDAGLIAKATKWINWTLSSQQADGSFGPQENKYDWWPRMPMLYALKDFQEATGDARVIPFLTNYFNFQRLNLGAHPPDFWGAARMGDNINTGGDREAVMAGRINLINDGGC